MYDPVLEMFLSPDDYIQDPGNPLCYNRFSYCDGNPLMYVDPSGYTWLSNFGDWLGGTGKKIFTSVLAIEVGIAVTILSGGTDLILAGITAGICSGVAAGIASAALNGGSFADYCVGAAGGALMGGTMGFATAGMMTGISALSVSSGYSGFLSESAQFLGLAFRYSGGFSSVVSLEAPLVSGISNSVLTSGGLTSAEVAAILSQFGTIPGLKKIHYNGTNGDYNIVPNGEHHNEFYNYKTGEYSLGYTSSNGDKTSDVYISPAATNSAEDLFITYSHEFVHVINNSDGLFESGEWAWRTHTEIAAWTHTLDVAEANGWQTWVIRARYVLNNKYPPVPDKRYFKFKLPLKLKK